MPGHEAKSDFAPTSCAAPTSSRSRGDAYQSEADQMSTTRRLYGMNLLGRWNHDLGGGSDLYLQSYIDYSHRDQPGAIHDSLVTFDVEFHQGLRPTTSQHLACGLSLYSRSRGQYQSSRAGFPAGQP